MSNGIHPVLNRSPRYSPELRRTAKIRSESGFSALQAANNCERVHAWTLWKLRNSVAAGSNRRPFSVAAWSVASHGKRTDRAVPNHGG